MINALYFKKALKESKKACRDPRVLHLVNLLGEIPKAEVKYLKFKFTLGEQFEEQLAQSLDVYLVKY